MESSLDSDEKNIATDPGFDQILLQLRQVVARLEQGNLPLEQALQAFEEGVRLSRQATHILNQAEHRVDVLMQTESGGPDIQPLHIDLGTKG